MRWEPIIEGVGGGGAGEVIYIFISSCELQHNLDSQNYSML